MGKHSKHFGRSQPDAAGSPPRSLPLHSEPARLFVRLFACSTQRVPGEGLW